MKKQSLEYTTEELLALIIKTFKDADGQYILLHTTEKPDNMLYSLYADPSKTKTLAYDPAIRDGFKFQIQDNQQQNALLDTPEDSYDLLLLTKNPEYHTTKIYRKNGQPAAAVEKNLTIIKIQNNFPNLSELQKAFKTRKTPTHITIKNQQIKPTKPTSDKTNPQEQKQKEQQILQKIKHKFQKSLI